MSVSVIESSIIMLIAISPIKYLIIFISLSLLSPHAFALGAKHELDLKIAYPEATHIRPNKKVPRLYDAFSEQEHIGYLIINTNFSETIGYSGIPIKMAVGVTTTGEIRGIQMLEHSEPIVLIGIPESVLMKPFEKYIGYNVLEAYKQETLDNKKVDIISGATVTVIVMDESVVSSILKAFRALAIINSPEQGAQQEIRALKANPPNADKTWQQLLNNGSVRNMRLTTGQVSKKFADMGYSIAAQRVINETPSELFIDLYLGVVSIDEIGRNLLGKDEFRNLNNQLKGKQQAIVIAANGLFSFRGSGFVRGGVFDRFAIEQGEQMIRFRDFHYKRLRKFHAEGAPKFTEIGLFYMPEFEEGKSSFDVTQEFIFNLLISQAVGPREKRFFNSPLHYQLIERFVDVTLPPLPLTKEQLEALDKEENRLATIKFVQNIWDRKRSEIITVVVLLVILTIIFFFQLQLTRHATLTKIVRYSFLTFVLVWLGFMQNAQLSVVNLLTVIGSFINTFEWTYFLRDPLVFILWCSVSVSIVLWARGAYCGWLCPFGALQELTNHIARYFKVPQYTMPWGLHERLWALKYVLFLGLLGASVYSFEAVEYLAEIEPFKTSIILKFQRTWPFVVYALALLTIGLFIERFFCRYLCPLGAGLAIPAKLKLFDWIKRYPNDCGNPCQTCAKECMVQAIHPEGNVNTNECINCLHCQVRYVDDQICPVVVKKRKKQERREQWSSKKTVEVEQNMLGKKSDVS